MRVFGLLGGLVAVAVIGTVAVAGVRPGAGPARPVTVAQVQPGGGTGYGYALPQGLFPAPRRPSLPLLVSRSSITTGSAATSPVISAVRSVRTSAGGRAGSTTRSSTPCS